MVSYWDRIFKTIFVQYIAASDQAVATAIMSGTGWSWATEPRARTTSRATS